MDLGTLFGGAKPLKGPLVETGLLPYRCPGVPEYAVVLSTNFAKTLVCKREYDVILWRHKQRITSNNDHHTPLLNNRIW